MEGRRFLQQIKRELQAGHHQSKKGSTLLAAFGYARRRQAVLTVIKGELEKLGLKAIPAIDEHMPLQAPYIRFYLQEQDTKQEEDSIAHGPHIVEDRTKAAEVGSGLEIGQTIELEDEGSLPLNDTIVSSFRVGELIAASKEVGWIKPNEPINKAYTMMRAKKYSQLVVAESPKPLATAIKGTISYQSITKALLNGKGQYVRDALDTGTPKVEVDDAIEAVIKHLADNDVVLVIGNDKKLSGVITAWDMANEFVTLVGPFKWIGEIESRIRYRLEAKVGRDTIVSFLNPDHDNTTSPIDVTLLTLGDLLRVVQNPDMWQQLQLPYDRQEFSRILDIVRQLRNRLMHFGEPLTEEETTTLRNCCQMLRDTA